MTNPDARSELEKKFDKILNQFTQPGTRYLNDLKDDLMQAVDSYVGERERLAVNREVGSILEEGSSMTIADKQGNHVEWYPNGLWRSLRDRLH